MSDPLMIVEQVRAMFDACSEALCTQQYNGGSFTCTEAELIYESMVLVGAKHAEEFMITHADTDDEAEDDMHVVIRGNNGYHDDQPIGWRYAEEATDA